MVDNLIAIFPSAVCIVSLVFFIVPLGYLSTPLCHLRWLACSMQISALVAGVFYLLWPANHAHIPRLIQMGMSAGGTQQADRH